MATDFSPPISGRSFEIIRCHSVSHRTFQPNSRQNKNPESMSNDFSFSYSEARPGTSNSTSESEFNFTSIEESMDNIENYNCNEMMVSFTNTYKHLQMSSTREEKSSTERENVTMDNEIILAIYWKRGKLGAAYYTTDEAEVHLLNDVVDIHPEFNNLRSLLCQIQYSRVVTCSSLADSFRKCLMKLVKEGEAGGMDGMSDMLFDRKLYFIPGKTTDLNYDSCKRFILGHRFGFEPKFSSEEEHILFVNTYIDFKQESMVMSLGILLKFLEKYIPQANLSDGAVRITMLRRTNLERLLSVDEATYKALQIFNTVHHPSAFKRSNHGSNREGLSVFGIFSRCKSRIGAKRMRKIFMNPIKDIEELNTRLDSVEFCCNPKHEHIVKNLTNCIKKVETVAGILTSIYRSRSNINHWRSLYSSLYNAILIGKICANYSTYSKLFLEIAESITENVLKVTHYTNHIIDFEESLNKNQFSVRIGIDKKLDKMRETYAQVPEVLVKVAEIELADLPEQIQQCSVVYITELGYLLSVPVWKGDGSNVADYQLPGFEAKFIVNKHVHFKTPRCAELDRVLGDLLASMCNMESKIMVGLMEFIHERLPDIITVVDLIAELDCIIAMADVASENNYIRPVLTTERKLEISMGRHPLQELCVKNFVPNDTTLSAEAGTIRILTGPNASGKSVYLKQIAVIAFLAHVGSFVPAQSARIGVLDHIHSRIHTVESISTRMSSFVLDLQQMSHALYNSTASSLIIIDEFGKGTTEIDGLSLLVANMCHFIERGENCPFLVVSTHFHKLPKLLPESTLVKLQYMEYTIENSEIVYLYKIKNGTCNSSLSHLALKRSGFSENSVDRFLEILSQDEAPLLCNPKLQVTKTMLKLIGEMKLITESQETAVTKALTNQTKNTHGMKDCDQNNSQPPC